jgi:hypothetical protein
MHACGEEEKEIRLLLFSERNETILLMLLKTKVLLLCLKCPFAIAYGPFIL